MSHTLKQIPRTWAGDLGVGPGDLATDFVLPPGFIATASLLPSQLGLPIINKTGSTITAGSLVYVNGRDATSGLATVALADADAAGKRAQWVALADILNNATATVGQQLLFGGQNTNAGNVGDPVYLSTTAGGYTLTAPTAANAIVQPVGNITVKSATVGVVNLALFYNSVPTKFGTNELQPLSVTGSIISANLAVQRAYATMPTIPTAAGATEVLLIASGAGTLGGFRFAFKDGLAAHDTNFIQFSAINKGANGLGATALLNVASGASSTKITGGAPIVAYAPYVPTLAAGPFSIAAGDVVAVTATGNGTLANTVSEGQITMAVVPT